MDEEKRGDGGGRRRGGRGGCSQYVLYDRILKITQPDKDWKAH